MSSKRTKYTSQGDGVEHDREQRQGSKPLQNVEKIPAQIIMWRANSEFFFGRGTRISRQNRECSVMNDHLKHS